MSQVLPPAPDDVLRHEHEHGGRNGKDRRIGTQHRDRTSEAPDQKTPPRGVPRLQVERSNDDQERGRNVGRVLLDL